MSRSAVWALLPPELLHTVFACGERVLLFPTLPYDHCPSLDLRDR